MWCRWGENDVLVSLLGKLCGVLVTPPDEIILRERDTVYIGAGGARSFNKTGSLSEIRDTLE